MQAGVGGREQGVEEVGEEETPLKTESEGEKVVRPLIRDDSHVSYVSAESPSNISLNPSEVISEVSEP